MRVLEVVKHLPAHGKQEINAVFYFACVNSLYFPY